jgi:hypothetical protein
MLIVGGVRVPVVAPVGLLVAVLIVSVVIPDIVHVVVLDGVADVVVPIGFHSVLVVTVVIA